MSDSRKKRGLGQGLSTLLGDAKPVGYAPPSDAGYRMVPIESVRPNPEQPRRIFTPAELDELTASIREKGVLQPLLVRPDGTAADRFMIVAGERRWRAAQAARLHEIPIISRDLSDEETLEIAIIENVQRADLNPIEEAAGYRRLIDDYGHTQEVLARLIGKSRPYVANALRLLGLPDAVQEHLSAGRLTSGHARALIATTEPARLARRIIDDGLSVRQAEALARQVAAPRKPGARIATKDADTRALEADLAAALGLSVAIKHGKSGGEITLKYKDLDDLDGLCRLLMNS